MEKRKLIWILAILAIITNILDSVTTRIGLWIGKSEANPLVKWFILSNNYLLFDIIKILIVIYLVLPFKYNPVYSYLIKSSKRLNQAVGYFVLGFIIAYFSLLVINNLIIMF